MKRILFASILVLITALALAQNRTMDTISFIKGGQLYKLLLYQDSLLINGNWYYTVPGSGTTGQYLRGDKTWQTFPAASWSPWDTTSEGNYVQKNTTKKVGVGLTPVAGDSALQALSFHSTRDIIVNGVTFGTGRGSRYYSTTIGAEANLIGTGTGDFNTLIGYQSGYKIGNGNNNVGLGVYTLRNTTSGAGNIGIGSEALRTNIGGHYNVAIGFNSLTGNTTGSHNVSNGRYSLYSNTTGYSNIAVGVSALQSNTTARNLVAIGDSALYKNTGLYNTAVGSKALFNNVTSIGNTAIGYQSQYNTTASGNTSTGYQSLYLNTSGDKNTAYGWASLYSNTDGYDNTAYGYESLKYNTGGYWNLAIGEKAMYSNTTGDYNTGIGQYSLYANTDGYFNTAVGHRALGGNTYGNQNTAIGHYALYQNVSGTDNTAIGLNALYSATKYYNTAIGSKALRTNTTGYSNTAVGVSALYSNTTASNLVAVGDSALYKNTYGRFNTAIGSKTLWNNTVSDGNVAIGYNSMLSLNSTGGNNTAVGMQSLYSSAGGSSNTAIGKSSQTSNSHGDCNTAIGYESLSNNTTGDFNVSVGHSAGSFTTSMGSNQVSTYGIYIGYFTKANASGETNQTVIGNNVIGHGSNTTTIGNTSTTDTYLSGTVVVDSIPNDTGADSVVTTKNGRLYRALIPTGTTYTATSPVDISGSVISIKPDTTTSWWSKQNHGETAFGWGNHATSGYVTGTPWTGMGYLTAETDPNIYAWAKAATKPAYTYSEVGAAATSHNQGISTVIGLQDSLTNHYTKAQADGLFEGSVGTGTTAQYYRGDKTWQTLPPDDTSKWGVKYNAVIDGNAMYNKDTTAKAFLFGKSVPFDGATLDILDVARIDGSANVYYGTINNEMNTANTGVGYNVLKINASNNNTGLGSNSLANHEWGSGNTGIGSGALSNDSTGSGNSAFGWGAMMNNLEGVNNTAVGAFAGGGTLGTGGVYIGYNAGVSETESNKLYINNNSGDSTASLLYGDFDHDRLRVNGDLLIKTIPTVTSATTLLTESSGNIRKISSDFLVKDADSTGSASGNYVTRKALIDSIAAHIPATIPAVVDVQVFTTPGANTWTKPTGAKWVEVYVIGGGGGGGSGHKGAAGTTRVGGGGGGAGGSSKQGFEASCLSATVTVTVGAGGTGGASITANSTSGSHGVAGGVSSFGVYLLANYGERGLGGASGAPVGGTGGTGQYTYGINGCNTGASGGAGSYPTSQPGAYTMFSPRGGGAGGGISSANAASNGSKNTISCSFTTIPYTGGAAGVVGTPTGENGWNSSYYIGQGGGGGASSITGNAGAGGDGGNYGSGGGGGGAAVNDVGNSGKGGNGAPGVVIVTTFF